MTTLSTERIILREYQESDWTSVHSYASQELVCRYQPWGPNTEEQTKIFVNEVIEDSKKEPRTRFAFAVIEKKTQKMIGGCEFNIQDFTNRNGEIGYIIHPNYWVQGIATEIAKVLLSFGFEEYQMHRIYATCDPRNEGSAKVLRKIGMTLEGRLRDHMLIKDGWRDSLVYSILEHEWKPYH